MDAMEIGKKLVGYCQQGRNLDAVNELYAKNIVSVEASAGPEGGDRESKGIEAVLGKNQWWYDNHEVHAASAKGPYPNGERFSVIYNFDVTHKPSGKRFNMEEVALYTVSKGKIVKEEFFYSA